MMEEEGEDVLVLVSNIPSTYHTSDLRRFFSDFVEQNKFKCFHFRHRVEKRLNHDKGDNQDAEGSDDKQSSTSVTDSANFSRQVTSRVHKTRENEQSADDSRKSTTCCLIKVAKSNADSFVSNFHRKHWLDSEDCEMMTVCLVNIVKEQRDLKELPELRPPNIMPRGNVGTSTKFFLEAIRDCRLPAKLIGKLKLEFPRGKYKKYGSVPLEYDQKEGLTLKTLTSINRNKLENLNRNGPRVEELKTTDNPDDDDDTCEEWERHEALHDDVQANRTIGRQVNSNSYLAAGGDLEQQAGTKEKALEDEIELVWEKGGSGLNFYTDVQFWRTQESQDFDEQTTDDWDVDMSVYYDKDTSHDKDAEDRFNMRESEFLRAGKHEESAFNKKGSNKRSNPRFSQNRGAKKSRPVNNFEDHSRGVARQIMLRSGWRQGEGLGTPGNKGISEPIDAEEEGQGPRDKTGLGYHGERILFCPPQSQGRGAGQQQQLEGGSKLVKASPGSSQAGGSSSSSFWRPPPPPGSRISSAYTKPEDQDPPERVERSNPALYMKFRNQSIKFHSGGTQGGGS